MFVDFKFEIHEKIIIIDLERPGMIDSFRYDINGKMYRIIYWYEGARKSIWMYENEIRHVRGGNEV